MKIQDTIDALLSGDAGRRALRVRADLDARAPEDWRTLAAVLAVLFRDREICSVAVAGGQGSGKSTLAELIVAASKSLGRHAVCASLDDFYLTQSERRTLAEQVHPLFATRGVPGTHDVALCRSTLVAARQTGTVFIPRFDKSMDERYPSSQWRRVEGPVDLFVLEGWCLGADAQPDDLLGKPANNLEAREDPQGIWRAYVNKALGGAADYCALSAMFEFFVFLAVPDMAAVVRWRTQQERALPAAKRMEDVQLRRFIDHYERVTTWMLETAPAKADLTVKLAADHTVSEVSLKSR
ncbi:MAG: kinase [Gammaproteobacteria bacterium]|nr:kinase [Gammaproteobacteria bacterium]